MDRVITGDFSNKMSKFAEEFPNGKLELLTDLQNTKAINRMNSLENTSPLNIGLKKIIEADYFSLQDRQYLIEIFSVTYQYNFFRYQLDENLNSKNIIIFREFYGKLTTGLRSLLSRYVANNHAIYNSLPVDSIERRVVDILLSYENQDHIISIVFNSLLNIMTSQGISRQIVAMEIGQAVIRHSGIKIGKSDNLLQIQVGLPLLENVLLRLPIFKSSVITESNISTTLNKLAIKPEDKAKITKALLNIATILNAELASIGPRKGRKKADKNRTVKPTQLRNSLKTSLKNLIKFLTR
jgi:hypothetical protein